jgi:hypothetical protein
MPDGKTVRKVAAPYEKAGWRPEQQEMAVELGYEPLEPKPGGELHAEQVIASFLAKNPGAKVIRWAIARGIGGNSSLCDSCWSLTKGWQGLEK